MDRRGLNVRERKSNAELRTVGIDDKKLVWFGHVERKDDIDWIKRCTVMDVDRRDAQENHSGMLMGI